MDIMYDFRNFPLLNPKKSRNNNKTRSEVHSIYPHVNDRYSTLSSFNITEDLTEDISSNFTDSDSSPHDFHKIKKPSFSQMTSVNE